MFKQVGGFTGVIVAASIVAVAVGNWVAGLSLVGVVLVVAVLQVAGRKAAGRRQAVLSGHGHTTVRGRLYVGALHLMGGNWASWLFDDVVDVSTGPDGLTFTPTPARGRFGGFRPRQVPWSDVLEVTAEDLGREDPSGKASFTRLTLLRFVLVGDVVPWFLRSDWLSAAEEQWSEGAALSEDDRAEAKDWAETLQAMELADGGQMGCLVVTLSTDHPGDLVDIAGRWGQPRQRDQQRPLGH